MPVPPGRATARLPQGTSTKAVDVPGHGSGQVTWTFDGDRVRGRIAVEALGGELELATDAEVSLSRAGTVYGVVDAVRVERLKPPTALGDDGKLGAFVQIGLWPAVEPLVNEVCTDLPFFYQARQADDRLTIHNDRILLAAYYAGRGVSLLLLPFLLNAISAGQLQPPIILFVVVYGPDWVATVPPTAALCREVFGKDGAVVYGWVFASHQIGAAAAALGAGVIRDSLGSYTWAWFGAAALCVVAAVVSASITRRPRTPAPTSAEPVPTP